MLRACALHIHKPSEDMSDTNIVIGAGITGLTAAITLQNAGKKVVVVEASERPGGRLVRIERNGDAAEAGGQGIHSNYRDMLGLIRAEGLGGDLMPQLNHQAGHLSRQGALCYPKGNLGLAKLMGPRGTRDLAWFVTRYLMLSKKFDLFESSVDIPAYDNATAAEAFSWAGEGFRDYVLRPAAHAMSNTTPEFTNFYFLLNLMKLVATTKVMTLRRGNASIAEHLAKKLDVRYGVGAKKILTKKGDTEAVLLEDGKTLKASHVILTAPMDRAAEIIPDDLIAEREFFSKFPNSPFVLVYFFLDRPLPTEAFVYVGHAFRDVAFNMAINHTVKTPHLVKSGKAIISAWSSFPRSAELIRKPDSEVIKQALNEIEVFFPGITGWVEEARVQRHNWGIARLSPGQHGKILKFKKNVEALSGISFAGNDYDGVHMESGVRGGLRAAQRALKHK